MRDAYVHHMRQAATLLGYQEPQILEVFKNTLPTKLYWFFSTNGPETSSRNGKKNFDKGKDRQRISRTDFLNSIYEHKRRVLVRKLPLTQQMV